MEPIITPRLKLRQWTDQDRGPFSALCADSRVMRYFPNTLSLNQSNAFVDSFSAIIEQRGFGFWAVELLATQEFIGFVGLNPISAGFDFAPCVEVGWRLKAASWGCGYATEAASASLIYGFDVLELKEVIAMTAVINRPSVKVMKKLGMQKESKNFMHPRLPDKHRLCEHVLYRINEYVS